jgi:D-3-phosphoglycerate dehydrogenase
VTQGTQTVDSLILDMLEWIGPGSRPYAEVIDAWRTSCPRLCVWEDATDLGFIARLRAADGTPVVSVSEAGRAALLERR